MAFLWGERLVAKADAAEWGCVPYRLVPPVAMFQTALLSGALTAAFRPSRFSPAYSGGSQCIASAVRSVGSCSSVCPAMQLLFAPVAAPPSDSL